MSSVIDLDDIDIGESPTAIVTATASETPPVVFPPVANVPRGEVYFDLETIPDESRRPLFGLDEPAVEKPFTNPPVNGELWVEWMKRPIAQIKEEIESYNPDETWLEAFHAWERKEKKPRQGILEIVKNIRAARSPNGDAEAERIKKMSVTPEFCRIVAMGIGWADVAIGTNPPTDIVNGFVVTDSSTEEIDLLEWWWDCAKNATLMVGYNILQFDLPVIFARSALLGVKPSRSFDIRPWGNSILDLMQARWPKGGQMKLKNLARVMGIEIPAGDCEGSQVYQLFKEDPVKLATYVKSDVVLCQQLRRMWRGYFC